MHFLPADLNDAAKRSTVFIVASNSLLLTTHTGRVTTELISVLQPIGFADSFQHLR